MSSYTVTSHKLVGHEHGDTVTDAEQSLEAEDHFDAETLRLVTAWADLILRQMRDDPKQFGPRLRAQA